MIAVSKNNTVVGIITRKDLTHLEWVVEKEEPLVADEPDDGDVVPPPRPLSPK